MVGNARRYLLLEIWESWGYQQSLCSVLLVMSATRQERYIHWKKNWHQHPETSKRGLKRHQSTTSDSSTDEETWCYPLVFNFPDLLKVSFLYCTVLHRHSFSVFQTCIVTHESNGIDIITALILNDISPLCRYRMEMVLQLKVKWSHLFHLDGVQCSDTIVAKVQKSFLFSYFCALREAQEI